MCQKFIIFEDFLCTVFYLFRYSLSTFHELCNHSVSVMRVRIRIRIGSAPHHFTDWDRYPGLADPDPADLDRYHFQEHVFFTFILENFSTGFPKYLKS